MEALMNQIRSYEDSMIVEAVKAVGGGHVGTDERMVRAALIEVYIERHGETAGDRLMDEIGM